MAITPLPGYIVDPNNPNGVIRDPGAVASAPATASNVPTPTPTNPVPSTPTATGVSPEDQKLLNMGVTPEQLKQLNTPEGLDPTSFSNLIGNVENKLKTNNDLVTNRGYLMKQLYDSPLTPEEKAKLPEDLQRVVDSGDKDTIELQLRLINDQIAGRANTLSQSIKYLADSYQTHIDDVQKQRDEAIGNVIDFVGQYGSKAPAVLKSLYGEEYLAKLKDMGIDINTMATISTLAQDREKRLSSDTTGGEDTFTKSQLNKGAQNAALGLGDFKELPYDVKNFFINASAANISDIKDVISGVKAGDVDPEEAKNEIDSLAVAEGVKVYLKALIDENAPASAETAKAPSEGFFSRYNPFAGKGFISNVKEGFKSLF